MVGLVMVPDRDAGFWVGATVGCAGGVKGDVEDTAGAAPVTPSKLVGVVMDVGMLVSCRAYLAR